MEGCVVKRKREIVAEGGGEVMEDEGGRGGEGEGGLLKEHVH